MFRRKSVAKRKTTVTKEVKHDPVTDLFGKESSFNTKTLHLPAKIEPKKESTNNNKHNYQSSRKNKKQANGNTKEKQSRKEKKVNNMEEKLRKIFNENSAFGKILQEKYSITPEEFIKMYAKEITKFSHILKSMFNKAMRKGEDAALRKFMKHPTMANLNAFEKSFMKAANRTQREAWAEYAKNLAKYLPMGVAASLALSTIAE